MECPHGFKNCIKTCNTPTCRNTCEYSATCCKEYCFFWPGSVLSDIQQGNIDHHPHVEEILKADDGGVLKILASLGQAEHNE